MKLTIVNNEFCKFERNKLTISNKCSREEWLKIGEGLKLVEGSVQFWIGDWARHGDKNGYYTDTKTYDEIEEITGYSHQAIKDMKYVANNIESSRRRDDISFNHYREVAKLESDKQELFLNRASEEKLSVRELRREIEKEKYLINIKEKPLPDNKYRVVYADPPWNYGNSGLDEYGHAERHYDTMTLEQISGLPIETIASNDAVLFLWATSPMLEDAFCVINSWGFKYKTSFVWDKIKHNFGYYNSVRHELLLIATRGSCLPDIKELHDSVIQYERTEHSEKPDCFRNLIESLYTHGKKIELFARNKSEGWDIWGNQV
jgi:N6-adenosine-specific RNA methylase IME4